MTYNEVDGEGTIYLPRLYRIYVNGLNINELNSLLNGYEYIKYPNAEVKFQSVANKVLVDGEVENPGLQTLSGSVSLANSSLSSLGKNQLVNIEFNETTKY